MKLYKNIFFYLLLLPVVMACSSDPVDTTGTIAGIVKDAVTNANLQGATVTLEGGNSVITGIDGRYQFNDVEMGTYKVSVSRNDYLPDERTVLVKVGEISNLDFSLRPAGSSLEVAPLMLDFGASDTNLTIDIKNVGQATLHWQIVENIPWLSCTPSSGTVYSGRQTTVTLTINKTGLSKGQYSETFLVTTTDGGSQSIHISMSVAGGNASLPQVSMLGVDGVTDVAASFSGTLTSIGTARVTSHGFCWSREQHPTLQQGEHRDLGATDEPKNFSYSVANLSPNTTYYVRAYATNAEGTVYSSKEERFTTNSTPQRPQVETGSASQVTLSSAVVAGNILDLGHESGIIQHGHVWSSETKEPTTDYSKTELGVKTQTGSFSSTLTNLKPGTTYYVRAYARNQYGISYGNTISFTTAVGEVKLTTSAVSDIDYNKATCGGRITELQGNTIKERGICWSTASNPTLAYSHAASTDKTDNFSAQMTGLSEKTTYHVRAYVTAATGMTYYGQDVQFVTSKEIRLPEASATVVSDIGVDNANLRASVVDNGAGTISDAGFCFSTTPNPTIANNKKSCGVQTGAYSILLSGLQENTHYYVRAYVVNERGTGYGEQAEFTTLAISLPTLSAVSVSNITYKSASFATTVTSTGNGTIKRTGFCYATTHNPTISDQVLSCGTNTTLQATASTLAASTTYYVRAFAENEKGIAYSQEVAVTTKEKPDDTSIGIDDYSDDHSWNVKRK